MNTRVAPPAAGSAACTIAILFAIVIASPQSAAAPFEDDGNQDSVTFKTETNLVLVPAVVRDANGNTVGNLRKEDFQLFDKGKPQVITKFTVEDTSGQVAEDRSLAASGASSNSGHSAPMAIPSHFVALVFDDLHMKNGGMDPAPGYIGDSGDLMFVRKAGLKLLDTLQPADRVAVFTTSGQVAVDFTLDRVKLREALVNLQPGRPILQSLHATDNRQIEMDTEAVLRQCDAIIRRMARLPGQRTVVFVSPGLLPPDRFSADSTVSATRDLIDLAIRSRVVMNSLDARGLGVTSGVAFQAFQAQISDGTGGRFITATNDLDGAMRQLAATPKYIYVLGFSPQALKPDGGFHTLTVKLATGQKLQLQARKGYYAPGAKELARKQDQFSSAKDKTQVDETQTKELAQELGIGASTATAPVTAEAAGVSFSPPSSTASLIAPPAAGGEAEISTHDEPVTFKAQSNLVDVPVVARDRDGHAIGNLTKDDFRLFDKGKRQEITKFSVEKANTPAPGPTVRAGNANAPAASPEAPAPTGLPGRFIAFVFDDLHIEFADLPQVRDAVRRYLRSGLQPEDRVALYTTSGKVAVDFTDKPAALDEALLKILPSPLRANAGSCLQVTYFQAVQIEQQVSLHPNYPDDLSRSSALKIANYSAGCLNIPDAKTTFDSAVQETRDAFTTGETESRAVLTALTNITRRMAAMPGQRIIVLASPGFFLSTDLANQGSDLISLAIRSKVLIDSIDARGVWTNPMFDASRKQAPLTEEITFRSQEGSAVADELIALAAGTGGTANLDNDFDGGVRKAAAVPEYRYILGFAPENLKADGGFHALKVTLNSREKASLQVRRGYYAPKRGQDGQAQAKQEMEDAVFSRDEIHSLPVEMHTQVTKTDGQSKLNVLASVDLKLLHFRKAEDRNRNDLTIIAAIFDPNGNFIDGMQKTLQLRLRDQTVQSLEQKPPVTIATNFDLKPGAYLVRLVVRDAEGQQLTAENAGVQVP